MGKYVAADEVQAFLETKVSFGNQEDQISEIELNHMIRQAESKVEMEMSDQYIIPFQGYNDIPFALIPYETTTQVIINLCLYRSIYNTLKLFFGKTSNNRGDSYINFISDMYHDLLDPLKRKRNTGVFDIPPLAGLMLNGNSQRVSPVLPSPFSTTIGHSTNSFEYANRRLNDPRATLIWGQGNRR